MNEFLYPLIGVFTFGVTMVLIPIIIKWAHKSNVLAVSNHRSSHDVPTPALGGVAIFFSLLLIIPIVNFSNQLIIVSVCGILLFLLGLLDDVYDLRAIIKLLVQIVVGVLLFSNNLKITNLHGILGINELSDFWSFGLTVSTVVVGINAFNLIDGINGLSGLLSLVNSLFFGLVFFLNGQLDYAILSFALFGALIGFLKYNMFSGAIFMGDTGSLLIGFIMTVFFILTFQDSSSSVLTVSSAFAAVFIPVFDLIRLFITRLLDKKNPMKADTNHMHHVVLKSTGLHCNATCIIVIFHLALFLMVGLSYYNAFTLPIQQVLGFMLIATFIFFCGVLLLNIHRKVRELNDVKKTLHNENWLLKKL